MAQISCKYTLYSYFAFIQDLQRHAGPQALPFEKQTQYFFRHFELTQLHDWGSP